jgi:hypothetical protein
MMTSLLDWDPLAVEAQCTFEPVTLIHSIVMPREDRGIMLLC